MTVVRKFLFDNDFDAGAGTKATAQQGAKAKPGQSADRPAQSAARANHGIGEAELAAAVDAARQEGERAGLAKGRAEANAATERQIAQALTSLANGFSALAKSSEQFGEAATHSVELAVAIARKLHPALAARNGLAEIEAILAACVEDLKREPRLVAYVAADNVDRMRERIDHIAAKGGFEGRIVLIGDDKLGGADCRVEWADGGVERSAKQTWQEIEAVIERCLGMTADKVAAIGDDNGR